jgi:hypothetical protein
MAPASTRSTGPSVLWPGPRRSVGETKAGENGVAGPFVARRIRDQSVLSRGERMCCDHREASGSACNRRLLPRRGAPVLVSTRVLTLRCPPGTLRPRPASSPITTTWCSPTPTGSVCSPTSTVRRSSLGGQGEGHVPDRRFRARRVEGREDQESGDTLHRTLRAPVQGGSQHPQRRGRASRPLSGGTAGR